MNMCKHMNCINLSIFPFQDLQFDDGGSPPEEITKKWLELVKDTFDKCPDCSIAVHCVAGLGR